MNNTEKYAIKHALGILALVTGMVALMPLGGFVWKSVPVFGCLIFAFGVLATGAGAHSLAEIIPKKSDLWDLVFVIIMVAVLLAAILAYACLMHPVGMKTLLPGEVTVPFAVMLVGSVLGFVCFCRRRMKERGKCSRH